MKRDLLLALGLLLSTVLQLWPERACRPTTIRSAHSE
jgi:hypothetical protein